MIDATFVKAIQDNAETEIVTVTGREYATKPVYNPPLPEEPRILALAIATLSGFSEFCLRDLEPEVLATCLIHIESPTRVSLLSAIEGVQKKRQVFVVAQVTDKPYPFGTFQEHSDFMIQVQTMFAPSPGRDTLQRVIGTVKDENVRTSMDTGVTQHVTASAGIALSQDVAVPNPVELRPYRTFREIEQPASLFVVRLQKSGDLPEVALFEADGGAWKSDAFASIRKYLAAAVPNITIIA